VRFARIVFSIAGIWGLAVVAPLYFTFDLIGRQYPPPITHADIYYGFVGVTLVWQIAFLIIATDPIRYRPMMIAAVLEKLVYITTMALLYTRGQLQFGQFAVAGPDSMLLLLFVLAFVKTRLVRVTR
jgi:hypothetical protein